MVVNEQMTRRKALATMIHSLSINGVTPVGAVLNNPRRPLPGFLRTTRFDGAARVFRRLRRLPPARELLIVLVAGVILSALLVVAFTAKTKVGASIGAGAAVLAGLALAPDR